MVKTNLIYLWKGAEPIKWWSRQSTGQMVFITFVFGQFPSFILFMYWESDLYKLFVSHKHQRKTNNILTVIVRLLPAIRLTTVTCPGPGEFQVCLYFYQLALGLGRGANEVFVIIRFWPLLPKGADPQKAEMYLNSCENIITMDRITLKNI